MGALEAIARNKGWGPALENNKPWQELKKKSKEEAVPYIQATLKEMGYMNTIMAFLSKNKS